MFKIKSLQINTKIKEDQMIDSAVRTGELMNLNEFIREQPVYPEWRQDIKKMEFMRAVQGTIAIEGSDLKLDEVKRITEQDQSNTDRDKEAENALRAYEFIEEWSKNNPGEEITESVIRQIHTIMTRDISYYLNQPGQYRNQPVQFGYPSRQSVLMNALEVQGAMNELMPLINGKRSDRMGYDTIPVTRAFLAHYLLTAIHPFIDGNGRVSRAVEALILHHYGHFEPYLFPVTAKFYYQERHKYFELLRHTDDTGDPALFMDFAINGLRENLSQIKGQLLDKITQTLIMDYAHDLRRAKKLLSRQTNLLEMMFYLDPMESGELWRSPSIRMAYEDKSESTRKRDLTKLLQYNLVKIEKNGEKRGAKIGVNWDVLKSVTLILQRVPHRPNKKGSSNPHATPKPN